MILLGLQVEGFRCFRGAHELSDLDAGLNLVLGPNESGKSTLFLGLHHAFFTPYKASGSEMESVRPWQTELAPKVHVEFQVDDTRYCLEKTFLDGAACRLSEWGGNRFEPVADGDAADNRVRELLLGERPGRGTAKAEHRGLARLLWVPQGDDLGPPTVTQAALGRIQSALGQMTVDSGEAALAERVRTMYAEIFTAAKGSYKKGADVQERADEIVRLSADLNALRVQHSQSDSNAVALLDRQAERLRLDAERDDRQREFEGLRAEIERVRQLRDQLNLAEAKLKNHQQQFERLDADRERLKSSKESLAEQHEAARKTDDELNAIDTRRESLAAEEKRFTGELERVRIVIDHHATELRQARKLKEARAVAGSLERLRTAIDEAQRLTDQRAERAKQLEAVKIPKAADVSAARKRADQLRELDGQLKSIGLSMAVRLEVTCQGTFEGSGGREELAFEVGEERRFDSADQASLELAGIGSIKIRSGAGEVRTLQGERTKLELAMRETLHGFGVTNIEELEARKALCDGLQAEITGLDNQIRAVAAEHTTLAGLKQASTTREAEFRSLCQEIAMPVEGIAQATLPDIDEFQRRHDAAVSQVRSLETERDGVITVSRSADSLRSVTTNKKTAAEVAGLEAQRVIDSLHRTYGDEQILEQAYHSARRERGAAEDQVNELKQQLPPPSDDPEARAQRLSVAIQQVEREIQTCHDAMVSLRDRIEQTAALGLYGQMVEKEEGLALATARHAQAEREARAIRLLNTLIDLRRKAVVAALTGPISEQVERLFSRVTAREGRRPVFNEQLSLTGIVIGNSAERSVRDLSGGTQEQLFLLTRLALAQYLAQSERMLFVLDDTLVNTDPRRHERFLAIIEEAAKRLQVILLSCHPERYRALQGAKIHKLE